MKLLRKILASISLTAAMFVFQACYGTPQWAEDGDNVFFHVTDEEGAPLADICIQAEIDQTPFPLNYTDSLGEASAWMPEGSLGNFRFYDQDSVYAVTDTSFIIQADNAVVNIVLTKQH